MECPICYEKKKLISWEPCSHQLCQTCLIQCLSRCSNCPICRGKKKFTLKLRFFVLKYNLYKAWLESKIIP